jgi:hypothetical protein
VEERICPSIETVRAIPCESKRREGKAKVEFSAMEWEIEK